MVRVRKRKICILAVMLCAGIMVILSNQGADPLPFCDIANYTQEWELPLYQRISSGEFLVPNIAHFNWYTDEPQELKFIHLLSLLSAYRIMKADQIYFHHNMEPTGPYWREAKRHIPNLVLVQRKPPICINGRKLRDPYYETSNSDADRLALMLEYGGVYLDLDVLITNSLDPLRVYPTTLGLEREGRVCGGFIMAAPNSTFMNLWVNHVLADYRVDRWAYITGDIPSKLIKQYQGTGIVHVEPKLLHHPNYNELASLIGSKSYDWSNNLTVHLWYRKWKGEDRNPNAESIKKMNSTFGEIARWIYYGSTKML